MSRINKQYESMDWRAVLEAIKKEILAIDSPLGAVQK